MSQENIVWNYNGDHLKKIDLLNKKYFIYAFVSFCMLLLFCILYKTVGFYYGINDDTTMQKIASGYYGSPDGHLVFIKYLLGSAIAALFRAKQGIDWYGLLMISLSFICYVLIISRMFAITANKQHNYWIRIICVLSVAILFFDTIIFFQFTVVAATLAATALFLTILFDSNQSKFSYVVIWVLYLLAALIRRKIFFMFFPLILLANVYVLFKCLAEQKIKLNKDNLKTIIKKTWFYAFVFVLGIVLFFSFDIIESRAYSSDPWSSYADYKHARSIICDYYNWPSYEGNEEFWDSIDVSYDEYKCINMFGILPDITKDKIVKIAELSKKQNAESDINKQISNMGTVMVSVIKSATCREQNLLLLVSLFPLLFCLFKVRKKDKFFILLGIAIQIVVLLYLLYSGRFPARVLLAFDFGCVLSNIAVFLLTYCDDEISFDKDMMHNILFVSIFVISLPLCTYTLNSTKASVASYREYMEKYNYFCSYVSNAPENIYFVYTGSVSSRKQFVIHDSSTAINSFGTSGWSAKSPWQEAQFEKIGINSENYLLDERAVFVTYDTEDADLLNNYFKASGKIDSDYEYVGRIEIDEDNVLPVIKWTRDK